MDVEESTSKLNDEIARQKKSYDERSKWFGMSYHFLLWVAPAAAAVTTLLAAFEAPAGLTAVAGAIATLAAGVIAQGRLQSRWANARITRTGLDRLQVMLDTRSPSEEVVKEVGAELAKLMSRAVLVEVGAAED